jgi:ATP-binding cassette subfamily B (MDR/TAP) protein 1
LRPARASWLIFAQAYLFANLIQTFTLTGQALVNKGNFWSLMFFVMALGSFVAYYILGWAAHAVSTVVTTAYRKEYMQNIIRKRIIYFDSEGNSAGTLTSRLSSDPTQIEQLMGKFGILKLQFIF